MDREGWATRPQENVVTAPDVEEHDHERRYWAEGREVDVTDAACLSLLIDEAATEHGMCFITLLQGPSHPRNYAKDDKNKHVQTWSCGTSSLCGDQSKYSK